MLRPRFWSWQQRLPAVGGQGAQHSNVLLEAWGLRRGCQGTGSHACHIKGLGLYFVGGGVPSTEVKSRSVLSDLNLESSAPWQFVDGFEGNKVGDKESISEANRDRIW